MIVLWPLPCLSSSLNPMIFWSHCSDTVTSICWKQKSITTTRVTFFKFKSNAGAFVLLFHSYIMQTFYWHSYNFTHEDSLSFTLQGCLTFSGSSWRICCLWKASIISYSFLMAASKGLYVLKSSIRYSNTSLWACLTHTHPPMWMLINQSYILELFFF